MEAPKRKYILTANIQADSLRDLSNALYNLSHQVNEIKGVSISGGVNSGWILELRDDGLPSHDAYMQALNVYLEELRK